MGRQDYSWWLLLLPKVLHIYIYVDVCISELRVQCNCESCSENNECLSRGVCKSGYWGDNCMLHDVLSMDLGIPLTVYITNSSTFSISTLVTTNIFFILLGESICNCTSPKMMAYLSMCGGFGGEVELGNVISIYDCQVLRISFHICIYINTGSPHKLANLSV